MAIEDFTFPIVSDAALPRFIDSPPLWHASSSSATAVSGQQAGGEQDHPRETADDHEEEEEEEEARMDLLWEDFNEKEDAHDSCSGSEEEIVKMGCVRGVTAASRTGAAMVAAPRRAAGLLVFVKMLRKLFHLHHHHSHAF